VNHQAPRFHRTLHALALIAVALMLCMPVISRWQQAQGAQETSAMCLSEASRAALAGHGHDDHARQHPADEAPVVPHAHHDHDACGYCVLATRMLPVLALVLALPLPLRMRHSPQRARPVPAVNFKWPAHSPRGPPIHS